MEGCLTLITKVKHKETAEVQRSLGDHVKSDTVMKLHHAMERIKSIFHATSIKMLINNAVSTKKCTSYNVKNCNTRLKGMKF